MANWFLEGEDVSVLYVLPALGFGLDRRGIGRVFNERAYRIRESGVHTFYLPGRAKPEVAPLPLPLSMLTASGSPTHNLR